MEQQLQAINAQQWKSDIFGYSVKRALREGRQEEVVAMIRDQVRDAPERMKALFGPEFVQLFN